ncbi:LysM peptidoglycan-binding domain-containing protein, partial [Cedecea neteri]
MNNPQFSSVSLKNTAKLCLFLQCFSVFSLSFAPVISAMGKESNLFQVSSTPYVLRAGETPASVAGRFGLTMQQLKTFNQFRVFHKPFVQLSG